MQVIVSGLNHDTAPVDVRECVAISSEDLPRALAALRALPGVREAAIVSTCNRTELYVAAGPDLAPGALGHFLPQFRGLPAGTVGESRMYTYKGRAAAAHLGSVAAGLNSAVLGETQILAQVKEAYQTASQCGTLGAYLHQLFNQAVATAKQVHTDTAVGLSPVSMGSVAIQLIRKAFAERSGLQVLVAGTGKMGRLALRHLAESGVGGVTVVSRSPDRAGEAAAGVGACSFALDRLEENLPRFDVVVAATNGTVLRTGTVERCMSGRGRPLLIIDLGMPRNVEPAVGSVRGVQLFNVDDLKQVSELNLQSRRRERKRAEAIIDSAADRYAEWMASRAVVPLIRSLSEGAERIRVQELEQALARLGVLTDRQRAVVEELTRAISRRLVHECTMNLKRPGAVNEAASEGSGPRR